MTVVLFCLAPAASALTIAATEGQALQSPWFLVPSTAGILVALGYLVVRIVRIGNDQMLLANKQAQVLVQPLREEVEHLRGEVRDCESQSQAERLWHQILVARLEIIIRRNGISIPEETWIRP